MDLLRLKALGSKPTVQRDPIFHSRVTRRLNPLCRRLWTWKMPLSDICPIFLPRLGLEFHQRISSALRRVGKS